MRLAGFHLNGKFDDYSTLGIKKRRGRIRGAKGQIGFS